MNELPIITKPCESCGTPVPDRDDPTFTGPWVCYGCHCEKTGRDLKTALNALAAIVKGVYKEPEVQYPEGTGCFYICLGCAKPIEHRGMCKGCSNAYAIGRHELAADVLSFGNPDLRAHMERFLKDRS